MPNPSSKRPRRPKDANQLAKMIVDLASQLGAKPLDPGDERNPAAVALGRLGGLKGGPARAKSLSAKQRAAIAKDAAKARWKGKRKADNPK